MLDGVSSNCREVNFAKAVYDGDIGGATRDNSPKITHFDSEFENSVFSSFLGGKKRIERLTGRSLS
jgi:hypothetical protein